MPQALDSGDRKLLIGAGVLLVALLIVSTTLAPPQMTGSSAFPSSYSSAWNGAKAAFLVLQDSGYRIERWERSPAEITGDAKAEVLILAEPVQPPSDEERLAIRDFLVRGGRVLATGSAAAEFLPHATSFDEGDPAGEKSHFTPLLDSPLSRDAPGITMAAPNGWRPQLPSQRVVYANEETAAVVAYPFGDGQVIWWAAATPLTNADIREAGNLALLLNSVGPSRVSSAEKSASETDSSEAVRVLWDEYFHGAHGSLWTYFARTPLPWGVAQFGLVAVCILATYSRRHGPVHAPLKVSRRAPLEFVETLGDLYRSAHAGSAAVRVADQRLRFMLTRQLALPANATIAEMARSAGRQLGWEEEPLRDTLTRAERFVRDAGLNTKSRNTKSDGEALALVQQLFDYSARMEMKRPSTQEGRKEGSQG